MNANRKTIGAGSAEPGSVPDSAGVGGSGAMPSPARVLRRLGIALVLVCLPVSVCINVYLAMEHVRLREVEDQNKMLTDGYENLRQVTLRMVMQLGPLSQNDARIGALLEEFQPALAPHNVWAGPVHQPSN